jgi:acetolactate synthase I/II/III large subunit
VRSKSLVILDHAAAFGGARLLSGSRSLPESAAELFRLRLGWGGAALGAKLAAPDRLVICVLGDGSHMFGNPVAVHHASALHKLPVLFVVMNNSMWGAVRRATLGMYPEGEAARSNKPPLIDLDELPAFEQVCTSAGGYGERVEDPAALPAALERAVRAVTVEKRQALLNVICRGP